MNTGRSAGILLHPTSLPGRAIGDFGDAAYRFVDWLVGAGQTLWQVLPLVPVSGGGSPYTGLSAFAGSPLLISPETLVRDGLLSEADLDEVAVTSNRVDYPEAIRFRGELLERAFAAFQRGSSPTLAAELETFRQRSADWLRNYAIFAALRQQNQHTSWIQWEPELKRREPEALARWTRANLEAVEREEFTQWLFDRQWRALRAYASERGVRIIGDIPIFVAYDSADVWAHPELFDLDPDRSPHTVSGVPPDYFSETGQLWGNPLYRWDVLAAQGYDWWIRRFGRTLEQVDIARIDHFRGFAAFWEVPAGEETAINGRWRPGPGTAVFEAAQARFGSLPLIAEDLGLITPDVEKLRDELGFPGMRVLQFAFGDSGARNPHLPANHPRNSVAYTGTHDNDTTVGWYRSAAPADRAGVRRLLGGDPRPEAIHWEMINLAFQSSAGLAVVPLQDVLGLGSEARMNTPGVGEGNWGWRVADDALTDASQARLLEVTRINRRVPASASSIQERFMNEHVVLVTGGAGNLGRAVTRAFLQAGARVAIPFYKTDRPDILDELKHEYEGRIFTFALDLTTERGAKAAVEQVSEWGGQLDAVAHLVGGFMGGARVGDTPAEVWEHMINLNLRSAWLVASAAIPEMVRQGGGSLVFVSSRRVWRERGNFAAYAVSKAGLHTLAKAISEEYANEGVRANVVLPGTVDTPENRATMPKADFERWTSPEEIARVIVFLGSSASGPINGAEIPVFGRS